MNTIMKAGAVAAMVSKAILWNGIMWSFFGLLPPRFRLLGRDLVLAAAARGLVVHHFVWPACCARTRCSSIYRACRGEGVRAVAVAATACRRAVGQGCGWRAGERLVRLCLLTECAGR